LFSQDFSFRLTLFHFGKINVLIERLRYTPTFCNLQDPFQMQWH